MRRSVLLLVLFAAMSMVPSAAVAQTSDTTPPVLVSVNISPAAIDVSVSDQTVTVTIDVSDDLSGFSFGYVYFQSPSGAQQQFAYTSMVSGDPLNGRHEAAITLPMSSEAGTWRISNVVLYDRAGNHAEFDTAYLDAGGFPTALYVTSAPDVTPPTLVSLAFTPTTKNVASGPLDVTFTVRITDDISGLDIPRTFVPDYYSFLTVFSPLQSNWTVYALVNRVSGTPQDGVYEATVRIPQYSQGGNWHINLQLYDRAGNSSYLSSDYAPLWPVGLPTTVPIVSSPADTTPPTVAGLSFSPAFINTSTGDQSVAMSVQVTDTLAGVHEYQVGYVTYCFGYAVFQSPSGGQQRTACLYSASQLTAGTPTNGTWMMDFYFTQYSEAGTWRLQSLYIFDGARNTRFLNTADLVAAGLPTEIVVIQPSLVVDGTVGSGGGTVQDEVFGGRAQITVPPAVLPVDTTVRIDVLLSPPDIPSPQGYGAAGSRYVNIQFEPSPSYPLPAPGLTVTIPLVESSPPPPGTSLTLFRVNPSTGRLVQAFGASGFPIVGTVNADGRSATFTGVISLSTIVALTRTSEVPGDVNIDGVVNCADLQIVKASFGKRFGQLGYDWRADVNRNRVVDINDLAYVSRLLPAGTRCP